MDLSSHLVSTQLSLCAYSCSVVIFFWWSRFLQSVKDSLQPFNHSLYEGCGSAICWLLALEASHLTIHPEQQLPHWINFSKENYTFTRFYDITYHQCMSCDQVLFCGKMLFFALLLSLKLPHLLLLRFLHLPRIHFETLPGLIHSAVGRDNIGTQQYL